MTSKRKYGDVNVTQQEPVDPSDELRFTCLGGGSEVGRSCHIIEYKGKTIMVCIEIGYG
jgi:cleavage and polyadenylation specificity factor subunit 3